MWQRQLLQVGAMASPSHRAGTRASFTTSRCSALPLRSYCRDCLNILVGAGAFDSLKDLDPWICYLCQPQQPHGALLPRADWSIRVQELFVNDSSIAFVRGCFGMRNPSTLTLLICEST